MVRRLTNLTAADEVPITCRADAFNKDHPTPPVIVAFLNSLVASFVFLGFSDFYRLPRTTASFCLYRHFPRVARFLRQLLLPRVKQLKPPPPVKLTKKNDADSEASQTKASPPSATSRGEREVEKKKKRPEDADGSESSGESSPTLVTPRMAVPPPSQDVEDPFDLFQVISS